MNPARASMSLFALVTIAVGARCAPIQPQPGREGGTSTVIAAPPVLDSVRPDSVVLAAGGIAEVTLIGTGFIPGDPGKNTVRFNGASFRSIRSNDDGRRIVFNIPDVISYGGGAPPSTLTGGSYSIAVETPLGVSNAVTVRVYR
jgi:hypothetical protein